MALKLSLLDQCRAAGLEPETEWEFCPGRAWRWDYCFPDQLLAVEVNGGVYSGGRHVRGRGFTEDARKLCEGVVLGWHVLAVTTRMVETGEALALIERALGRRG